MCLEWGLIFVLFVNFFKWNFGQNYEEIWNSVFKGLHFYCFPTSFV
jgi:hypothetical protein